MTISGEEVDSYELSGHPVYQRLKFVLQSPWTKTSLGKIAKARESCSKKRLGGGPLSNNRTWYVKRKIVAEEEDKDESSSCLSSPTQSITQATSKFSVLQVSTTATDQVEQLSFTATDDQDSCSLLQFIPGWIPTSPYFQSQLGIDYEIVVPLSVPPMSRYQAANEEFASSSSSVIPADCKIYTYNKLIAKTNLGNIQTARRGIISADNVMTVDEEMIVVKKSLLHHPGNQLENPLQEIAILLLAQQDAQDNSIKHRNVMQLLDCYQDEQYVYYIMPLALQPRLFDQIHIHNNATSPPMTETQAKHFLRDICTGLKHMHDLQIVVRDISLANTFQFPTSTLDNNTPDITVYYALGDFGFSFRFPRGKLMLRDGRPYGKNQYNPPEQYRQDCVIDPFKGDIWAVGVMLFEVLTKQSLCSSANAVVSQRFHLIETQGVAWFIEQIIIQVHGVGYTVSADLTDLLVGMLCLEPFERLDVDQVLAHRWLR